MMNALVYFEVWCGLHCEYRILGHRQELGLLQKSKCHTELCRLDTHIVNVFCPMKATLVSCGAVYLPRNYKDDGPAIVFDAVLLGAFAK